MTSKKTEDYSKLLPDKLHQAAARLLPLVSNTKTCSSPKSGKTASKKK